jgi:hypothetical protein
MPIFGLGIHVIVALFFAVHAVRSGQPMYWLFILFAFPVLGSIVYFLAVYFPNSKMQRQAFKAIDAAANSLDPGKALRLAQAAYEDAPTAQNRMQLAEALLGADQAEAAASHFEAALQGPFSTDPELRHGAARAWTACQRYEQATVHLQVLLKDRPEYRADSVALLLARCLAGTGRTAQAQQAFEGAVQRFGSFEAHAEYAIWALATGDTATANRLQTDIDKMVTRWNPMSRELNEPVLRRLQAARARAAA